MARDVALGTTLAVGAEVPANAKLSLELEFEFVGECPEPPFGSDRPLSSCTPGGRGQWN